MKKTLVGIAVAVCLFIAGLKIYSFYQAHQPPFEVGECFSIFHPQIGDVKFEVVENDKTEMTTVAVGQVDLMGYTIQVPVKATFDEIRESGAKEVSCE